MKPYMDSSQYDESRNRFEHSAGYRNDKGLFDVLGLAGAFLTRDRDPAEQNGMPLLDPLQSPPAGGDGHDVTWIGHASLLFRRHGVSVLTDPVFSDRASPFPFSGPKRVWRLHIRPNPCQRSIFWWYRMRITTISIFPA